MEIDAGSPVKTSPQNRAKLIGIGLALLWTIYCLNGFRPPTQAIELSDSDAGSMLRQILFGGSAMLAGISLWMLRKFWATARLHWAWIIFGIWIVCSVLYSDQPGITFKRAFLFNCGLLTSMFIASFSEEKHLDWMAWLIAILCASVSLMSILWMLVLPSEITTNPGRSGLAGVSNHPNTLSPACAIGTILWVNLNALSTRQRLFKLIGFLSCSIALVLTGSVTSMFLAVVGTILAALLSLGGYASLIAVLLVASTVVATMIAGPAFISDEIFSTLNRDSSMSGRDQLWKIIIEQIQSHPFFGHGWGAFWTEGKGRELVQSWNPRQSHNAYLDVLLDIGVIGILVVMLPVIITIKNLRILLLKSNQKSTQRTAAGCLGCAISLLMIYGFQQSFIGKPDSFVFAVLLWISVGVNKEIAEGDSHKEELG